MDKVAILLSTYNGSEFLKAQLDSLLEQDYPNFTIFIRDDYSTDSTIQIIETFEKQYPEKINFLKENFRNIGVLKSFTRLLNYAEADIYFFCDQDDIWLPNKIATMQAQFNNDEPKLVFCDSEIIGNYASYHTFFRRHPLSKKQISRGLFIGFVPGCMMAFNQKAKIEYLKSNIDVGLHDSKMFLVTYLTGSICFYDKPLMHYRIHSNNTVGLGNRDKIGILTKDLIRYVFKNEKYRKIKLREYFEFVKKISLKYNSSLVVKKELLNDIQVSELSYFKRKNWYIKHFKPFHKGWFEGFVRILCI